MIYDFQQILFFQLPYHVLLIFGPLFLPIQETPSIFNKFVVALMQPQAQAEQ